MRSVEDQLAAVVEAAAAPEPIRVALTDALGLMCAEEVTSTTVSYTHLTLPTSDLV